MTNLDIASLASHTGIVIIPRVSLTLNPHIYEAIRSHRLQKYGDMTLNVIDCISPSGHLAHAPKDIPSLDTRSIVCFDLTMFPEFFPTLLQVLPLIKGAYIFVDCRSIDDARNVFSHSINLYLSDEETKSLIKEPLTVYKVSNKHIPYETVYHYLISR